jgi:hypothetical protein
VFFWGLSVCGGVIGRREGLQHELCFLGVRFYRLYADQFMLCSRLGVCYLCRGDWVPVDGRGETFA